jgi:hypothetical protein
VFSKVTQLIPEDSCLKPNLARLVKNAFRTNFTAFTPELLIETYDALYHSRYFSHQLLSLSEDWLMRQQGVLLDNPDLLEAMLRCYSFFRVELGLL